ncbi:MAG: right-handed parallel beta-helix repeat-containing protein [Planctomycetota bacterium]
MSLREITVGPTNADVIGTGERAIQIALDTLAHRGGGTVLLAPGTYTLRGPVRLRSNVALIGVTGETILKMAPVVAHPLAVDADIGQHTITPAGTDGLQVGSGVVLRDRAKPGGNATMPLTVVEVADGTLHVDDYIVNDWIAENGANVVNYFPLVHGFEVAGATVEGLILDSQPDNDDALTFEARMVWGACLYIRRGTECAIRNVVARHCYGDGIRFGQSRGMLVEHCEAHDNKHYGMHPGSHSPETTVRHCHIHHNGSDGLYLCWGVHHGEFTDNDIHHNGGRIHRNGISIGHKDTDNLIARNHVWENAKHGLCFRIKTDANGAHRNVVRENIIENNGSPESAVPATLAADKRNEVLCAGVHVRGATHDLTFERNTIRETRPEGRQYQYNAFYLAKDVSRVKLVDNDISDHPGGKVDDQSGDDSNDLRGL